MGKHANDIRKHGIFQIAGSKEAGREARTESRLRGLYPNTGQIQQAGSEVSVYRNPLGTHQGRGEESFYITPEISLLNRKRVIEGTESHRGIELLKR